MKSLLKSRSNLLSLTLAVATLGSLAACQLPDPGQVEQANDLFDLRLLLIPSPGQLNNTQALCSDGAEARALAQQLVDEMNAAVATDRALLEALAGAAADTNVAAIKTYSVEVDGRTMTVEDVTNGESHAITGSIDGAAAFSATTTDEGRAGTLNYGDLSVAWDEEDGVLRAARDVAGETPSSQAVHLEPDRVRIVSSSASGDVSAGWTATSGVIVDGGTAAACWEGDEQCDVACNDELVAELQISLSDG